MEQKQIPNKSEDTGGKRLAQKKSLLSYVPRPTAKGKSARRWQLTKKERLLWILPAVAIVVLLVITWNINRHFTDYTLEVEAYQYYGGGQFRYKEGTVFRYEDGKTMLVQEDSTVTMTALPLYTVEDSLFLPCNMLYWDTLQVFQTRIEYYTQVSIDQYEQIIFTREESDLTVTGGFLYDGGDLYVFLEPMILKFNGYEIYLDAFSYVEVSATEDLMFYDHFWGEFYTETPTTGVVAVAADGDYTISLIGDTVQAVEGTSRMLASQPTDLDCLFE